MPECKSSCIMGKFQLFPRLKDADFMYGCNWLGRESVSMNVKYVHTSTFRSSLYRNLTFSGQILGQIRQAGKFRFVRVYNAGHMVPYYTTACCKKFGNEQFSGRILRLDWKIRHQRLGLPGMGRSKVFRIVEWILVLFKLGWNKYRHRSDSRSDSYDCFKRCRSLYPYTDWLYLLGTKFR